MSKPFEQKIIQSDSIKAGIQAHAETYSFNIESKLFNQLTKEQQELWRKELEQACISGGEVGVELARDPRYKENHSEVKEELSVEEKAKRYDEAIKIAKDSFNYPDYPGFIRADVVFPELKESEHERIRKELLNWIKACHWDSIGDRKLKREDIIAWLEKQKEQESTTQSVWSEEDEKNKNNCIYWLKTAEKYFKNADGLIYEDKWLIWCIDWLNSIKDKFQESK